MTKIILAIAVISVVLGMLGGISILKNNYYWKAKYFHMQLDHFKTKLAFGEYYYGGFFQWLGNLTEKNVPDAGNAESAQSVPVLLYHGVIDQTGWQSDEVNISVADFRNQMFALKKAGYRAINLSQFLSFMQEGKPLPKKSFMITFDDSRTSSYYPVDPILRVLDYKAVMFVITGRSFEEDNEKNTFHLSEDELKKMLASGRWDIASHTQNGHGFQKIDAHGTQGHFLSDKLWIEKENRLETEPEYADRIKTDLVASKNDLEKNLGIKTLAFAFPFGDFGKDTQNFPGSKDIIIDIVNSLFPLSFRQVSESEFSNNYPEKNFRLIKRINVNSNMSKDQLLFILNSGQEKTLPYSDTFFSNNGWFAGWGSFELKDGLLLARASTSEDSSLTFLNGTFNWTNYTVGAIVRLIQGNAFAIVARYIDGNNYVSCDFSNEGVALSQRILGIENTLSKSNQELQITPDKNTAVGVGVSENTATCYIEGRAVVSGNLSANLSHGGIGFKTWNNIANNSSLLISHLSVSPAQ